MVLEGREEGRQGAGIGGLRWLSAEAGWQDRSRSMDRWEEKKTQAELSALVVGG